MLITVLVQVQTGVLTRVALALFVSRGSFHPNPKLSRQWRRSLARSVALNHMLED